MVHQARPKRCPFVVTIHNTAAGRTLTLGPLPCLAPRLPLLPLPLAVLSALLYTNAGFTAIAGSNAGGGGVATALCSPQVLF